MIEATVVEPTTVASTVVVHGPPLVRSPLFAYRLLMGIVLTLLGMVLLLVFEQALLGLREDLATLQASFPSWLPTTLEIVIGVTIIGTILATNVGLLVTRRFRWFGLVNAAAVLAIVLTNVTAEAVIALATSDDLVDAAQSVNSEISLGNSGLASVIAVLTLTSPWINRRLRPWVVAVVGAVVSLSFIGATVAVVTLPFDIGMGITAGALVALALRTPDRMPDGASVAAALTASGVDMADIDRASVDARGSVPWFGTTADGSRIFVKSLGSDQRAADLLFRLYRWVRLRNSWDRRPFPSLGRAVEHEALLSLAARAKGIRTPQLLAIGAVGSDGMLLAYERITGKPLDDLPPEEVTPAMVQGLWRLVADLDRAGIAHRDLRLANVLVAENGTPWLIDFGFAELAASHALRLRDVAELISSTSAKIGAGAAARSAVEVLGPEHVGEALPWIQPLGISSATRTRIGRSKDFERLRKTVADVVDSPEPPPMRMERVSGRTLLLLGSFALAAYVLLPQLAEASGFFGEVRSADLRWVGVAAVASALTYVGAAIGVVGAVPVRLSVGLVVAVQVASSFASRVTPAKLGGMAANVRFLQRRSIPTATAVSAIGLNTIAGLVVHVSLVTLVALAAGSSNDVTLPVPNGLVVAAVTVGLAVVGAVLWAIPAGRQLLTANLVPALRSAWATVSTIARTPSKLVALLTGSFIVTFSYTIAMLASLRALDANVPVATAALVYLVGSAVATVAPTPGGVGATEAALIAGYTAVGVDPGVAFAAVLLFRLVTFWLPILPGWVALITLQRRGDL